MSQGGQRTARSLKVAGAQIVEHQRVVAQVPLGQRRFDTLLSDQQPIHSRVQIVLVAATERQHPRQGGSVPPPCRSQLAHGRQDARGHHGDDPIAFLARARADESIKAQLLHGISHGLDMTVMP